MEIKDIIKESLVFPSNNLDKLAIYVVMLFVLGLVTAGGIISIIFALFDSSIFLLLAGVFFLISIALALWIKGYEVSIMRAGIEFEDDAPSFYWKKDIVIGIKMLILSIVYFIIPAMSVVIIALITNVPGNLIGLIPDIGGIFTNPTAIANSTVPAVSAASHPSLSALGGSILITAILGAIIFVVFAFIQTMGEARLANTGSLSEALDIPEAAADIGRIGYGKVLAVVLIVVVILAAIEAILGAIYGHVPQLSIISIVLTPYLVFFAKYAYGLMYLDIA
ncbi:MAG: DUF4013 domain-containing protein [Methanobrevibacter sp.]|uniref:DUF4013 domain-containing protein n=1 Tax=Methanobrevibacter sp. TaxID=66852 RepID=UPI001B7BC2D8|nr:DUF4013 domain-containing protein [Methanobrevibacter sp.]MBP3791789.1 DUF4013 domain-containing protein [Methanobrevibacter sp.]